MKIWFALLFSLAISFAQWDDLPCPEQAECRTAPVTAVHSGTLARLLK